VGQSVHTGIMTKECSTAGARGNVRMSSL